MSWRRRDGYAGWSEGRRSRIRRGGFHPQSPVAQLLDVHGSRRKHRATRKPGITWKAGVARKTGIARVAPISVCQHPVEPVARKDSPEVSAFDINHVVVVPGQPPDPLAGGVEDVLAPPKSDPPPRGVVEVLNGRFC